jgi:uncharacterized protein
MRLVLDTNVVESALLWGGAPGLLLRQGESDGNSLYTSRPMLLELLRVLSRSKFERKISAGCLPADKLVELYVSYVNLVKPLPAGGVCSDPDDDVVVGTALAAKADCLATGDKVLLQLRSYEGIRILTVREVLETMREK